MTDFFEPREDGEAFIPRGWRGMEQHVLPPMREQLLREDVRALEDRLRQALVMSALILRAHGGTVEILDADVERMELDAPTLFREETPGGFRLILLEQEGTEDGK